LPTPQVPVEPRIRHLRQAGQLTVTSSAHSANNVTAANPTGTLITTSASRHRRLPDHRRRAIASAFQYRQQSHSRRHLPVARAQRRESGNTLEQVQVVIANDNSGVESTVNQFVTDYNSLISAINAQEGTTVRQCRAALRLGHTLVAPAGVLGGLDTASPNGYVDTSHRPPASPYPVSYHHPGGTNPAQTVNVGDASTPDTLFRLMSAINAANMESAQVSPPAAASPRSRSRRNCRLERRPDVISALSSSSPTPVKYSEPRLHQLHARHRHTGHGRRLR